MELSVLLFFLLLLLLLLSLLFYFRNYAFFSNMVKIKVVDLIKTNNFSLQSNNV